MPTAYVAKERIFIISIWLEALCFGFLVCIFLATLYVNLTSQVNQSRHGKIMFYSCVLMFFTATVHVAINGHRLIQAFVVNAQDPFTYLQTLNSWHQVTKTALLVFQESTGDAAAIYRTWIVWDYSWKPVCIPFGLLIATFFTGFMVCWSFAIEPPGSVIFAPQLGRWITTFNSLVLIQSAMTTGLIAYRIWEVEKESKQSPNSQGRLFPIVRILVESTALQFVAEGIMLGLYASSIDEQYLFCDIITPVVAIAFSAATIRVAFHSHITCDHDTDFPVRFTTVLSGPRTGIFDDDLPTLTVSDGYRDLIVNPKTL